MGNTSFQFESLESRQLMSFGQPVADFGVAGRASVAFTQGNANPSEMLVDGSGRIVTVSDAGLARWTALGQLDGSFGTAGRTPLSSLSVRDAAIDSSGRIVIVAFGASGTLLLRYTAAGATDNTFGTNGAALVTSRRSFSPRALAIQSDGKFVVAGTIKVEDENSNDSFTTRVYRNLATGGVDTSFDTDGAADLQLAPTDLLHPLPLDAIVDVAAIGGRIVVAGGSQVYSPAGSDDEGNFFPASYGAAQLVAAALTADGAPDTGWGSNGFARAVAEGGQQVTPVTAGKIFSDGLIGLATSDRAQRLFVARFNADGGLIRQTRGTRQYYIQTPRDIALLPDGRFAIVGTGAFNNVVSVVTLNSASEFGPIVRPRDENGDPLFNANNVQIATTGDDFVLGGQAWFNSTQERLIKLDGGAPTERPNQFAGGSVNDVVVDANGLVHLAYYDATARKLMYAQRDAQGIWKAAVAIDGNPLAGQFLSIDVEPTTNRPAIAYYDGTNADLKLAQWNGRRWVYTNLDSAGTTGQYPSLQFGQSGNLSIAYYNRSKADAKFVTRENAAWVYQTIESAGDVGRYMYLEYTPNSQRPSVAYTSSTGVLKYAARGATGNWTVTDVTTVPGAGPAYVSLGYGGFNNRGAISYYDAQNADLKLAYFDGSAWKTKTLATVGAQGLYTQVYAPFSSELFVFAYNRSKDRFSVFTTSWEGNTTTETLLDTAYGRNLTVAIGVDGTFVAAAFDSVTQNLHVTEGYVQ